MDQVNWDYFHLSATWVHAEPGVMAIGDVTSYMARERHDTKRYERARKILGVTAYMDRSDVVTDRRFYSLSTLSRDEIWEQVDQKSRRCDGEYAMRAGHLPRLASFVDVRFPDPLTEDEKMLIADQFSQDIVRKYGCAIETALHKDPSRGTLCHMHLLMSDRVVDKAGVGTKIREWNSKAAVCAGKGVKDGEIILAPHAEFMRSRFSDLCAQYGVIVDHRSFKRQGLPYKPTPWVPNTVVHMQTLAGKDAEWRVQRAVALAERRAEFDRVSEGRLHSDPQGSKITASVHHHHSTARGKWRTVTFSDKVLMAAAGVRFLRISLFSPAILKALTTKSLQKSPVSPSPMQMKMKRSRKGQMRANWNVLGSYYRITLTQIPARLSSRVLTGFLFDAALDDQVTAGSSTVPFLRSGSPKSLASLEEISERASHDLMVAGDYFNKKITQKIADIRVATDCTTTSTNSIIPMSSSRAVAADHDFEFNPKGNDNTYERSVPIHPPVSRSLQDSKTFTASEEPLIVSHVIQDAILGGFPMSETALPETTTKTTLKGASDPVLNIAARYCYSLVLRKRLTKTRLQKVANIANLNIEDLQAAMLVLKITKDEWKAFVGKIMSDLKDPGFSALLTIVKDVQKEIDSEKALENHVADKPLNGRDPAPAIATNDPEKVLQPPMIKSTDQIDWPHLLVELAMCYRLSGRLPPDISTNLATIAGLTRGEFERSTACLIDSYRKRGRLDLKAKVTEISEIANRHDNKDLLAVLQILKSMPKRSSTHDFSSTTRIR